MGDIVDAAGTPVGAVEAPEVQADQWAAEVNLIGMIGNILQISNLSRGAPEALRQGLIARQQAEIDAIVREAFIEGMHRGSAARQAEQRTHSGSQSAGPSANVGSRSSQGSAGAAAANQSRCLA